MTRTIDMTLREDPGGVPLLSEAGRPIGIKARLIGTCADPASNIINDPAPQKCDLSKGDLMRITLDVNALRGATFAGLPAGRPGFCINRSETDKTCLNKHYVKITDVAGKAITVKVKNLPRGPAESTMFYSLNFAAPKVGLVSLDPRVTNRPRDEVEFLSFATMLVIGVGLIALSFFVGRAFGIRSGRRRPT